MVERRTPNREVLGSIPTSVIVVCALARHINSLHKASTLIYVYIEVGLRRVFITRTCLREAYRV